MCQYKIDDWGVSAINEGFLYRFTSRLCINKTNHFESREQAINYYN